MLCALKDFELYRNGNVKSTFSPHCGKYMKGEQGKTGTRLIEITEGEYATGEYLLGKTIKNNTNN